MTRSRWIILVAATLLLLIFGYQDVQELGVSRQNLVVVIVGYLISAAILAGLVFGWKENWRRHIQASILIVAVILFAGRYAAPDDSAAGELSGPRGVDPTSASAGLGVKTRKYAAAERHSDRCQRAGSDLRVVGWYDLRFLSM